VNKIVAEMIKNGDLGDEALAEFLGAARLLDRPAAQLQAKMILQAKAPPQLGQAKKRRRLH
jgi:hypothetical protein